MSLFYDGAIRMARTQIILGPENAVPRPPTSVCHSQNVSAGWWKATLGARKQGVDLKWQEAPGTPDRLIGEDKNMRHDAEKAVGLGQPIQLYPLFENALRYARHESIPAHLKRISELWARFSDVASGNPHAWIQERHTADEIRTPSASKCGRWSRSAPSASSTS